MNKKKNEYIWSHNLADNSFSYLFKSLNKIIRSEILIKRNLLDVGCGNGFLTKKIGKNFENVFAIDTSISAINQAKKEYFGNINFSKTNLDEFNSNKQFDCITLLEVIEHLYSPDKMLQSIHKVSSHDTKIIISTPYHGFIKNLLILLTGKFNKHFSPLWEDGHIKFFSKSTLVEICKRNNFTVEKISYSGRFFPISKSIILIIKKAT